MRTLLAALTILATTPGEPPRDLKEALLFHAGFDGGTDAGFGAGDRAIYQTRGTPLRDVKPGLPETVEVVAGAGKYGGALRFSKKIRQSPFYKAAKHTGWTAGDFKGTVSFWLKLDPEEDLEPGYCDPIQLTDKKWNDACLWVDFDKEGDPREFRLGVFSDMKVWNPEGRKLNTIPPAELPRVVVKRHPFTREAWTHVCFTWDAFNSGSADAVARLYLNGALQGELKGKQAFTWDPAKAGIVLGVNYVGLIDDVAVFGRALSAEEVRALGGLESGVQSLYASR